MDESPDWIELKDLRQHQQQANHAGTRSQRESHSSQGSLNNIHRKRFLKIVLVGGLAGKTALIQRYVKDEFKLDFKVTIGVDFALKVLEKDGWSVCVQVWDLGAERFSSMNKVYLRDTKGLVVVFDVTRIHTFESIKDWAQGIHPACPQDVPRILVGNRADLQDHREVSTSTAQEFADSLGIPYIETSAKTGYNVEEAFNLIIDACLEKGLVEELEESPGATSDSKCPIM